jgi:division protein CdvB (Snf7/Vps24/ESCRT-III family)
MSFGNKWTRSSSQSHHGESISENVRNKLVDGIKSSEPLKLRIEEAQKKLQMQISKLDTISTKIYEKDKLFFNRVVQAVQNHDSQHAKLLSNELSQVRKMNNMVDSAKMALEQIQLRLNTMTELGDIVVTLSPAMSVIKGIQGGLSSMMPEADQSLEQISELLGNIMSGTTDQLSSSSQKGISDIGTMGLDDEAVKIMEEATANVAEDTRSKFPDLLPIDNNRNSKHAEDSSSMY